MISIFLFWISFLLTVVGVFLGIAVVRLAKGGVLSGFTWWLAVGIVVFAIHHVLELMVPGEIAHEISEGMENFTSLFFLIGTVLLIRTIRKLA